MIAKDKKERKFHENKGLNTLGRCTLSSFKIYKAKIESRK
jgi:hypothetical protein